MYLALDTETTGLDPEKNGIITLSANVYDSNLNKTASFNAYNRSWPAYDINPKALSVNGFKLPAGSNCSMPTNMELVSDYIIFESPEMLCKNFCNWIMDFKDLTFLVGMNVNFDIGFLRSLFSKSKIEFGSILPIKIIDVQTIFSLLSTIGKVPKLKSVAAKSLYEYFGMDYQNIHSSKADVEYTWQVWEKLYTILKGV